MFSYHMRHPNSSDLMLNINGPKSIVIPNDWCEKEENVAKCICQRQHDVQIVDIGQVMDEVMPNETHADAAEDSLALTVDWWTEGVVLLIISAVGIIGNLLSFVKLFISFDHQAIFSQFWFSQTRGLI